MEDQDKTLEKTKPTETKPDDTNAPIINIDNLSMRQLMELDACTRCGECSIWCPAYEQDKKEGITPRGRAKALEISSKPNMDFGQKYSVVPKPQKSRLNNLSQNFMSAVPVSSATRFALLR